MFKMAHKTGPQQINSDKKNSDGILAQLYDMFCDSVPHQIIQQIGNEHNWELDECIEHLIKYNSQSSEAVELDDDADILIESEEIHESTPPPALPASITPQYTGTIPKSRSVDRTDSKANTNPSISQTAFQWPSAPQFAPNTSVEFSNLGSSNDQSKRMQNSTNQTQANREPQSFSSFLKNAGDGNRFTNKSHPQTDARRHTNQPEHSELQNIIHDIKQGYRVMIVMRGAPGSGKSYLSRRIINETTNGDFENHVFSTDDFFYDKKRNRYVYNPEFLEAAHNANQSKVAQRALNGWSPIIIDNTNMKLWEMVPYIRDGVKNGFLIKILEPITPWARTPGKLAMKNKHNVPIHKIERILSNYEPTTIEDFFNLMKLTYTHPVPVLRNYPPLSSGQYGCGSGGGDKENSHQNEPRGQRKRRQAQSQNEPLILTNVIENDENDTFQKAAEKIHSANNEWIAFDPDKGAVPWESDKPSTSQPVATTMPREQRVKPAIPSQPPQLDGLFNLLRNRDDATSACDTKTVANEDDRPHIKLVRHGISCPNENKSFQQIRQIYPKISISFLWDLFEKCNGDGDWTMDILLKDEDTTTNFNELENQELRTDIFMCNCSLISDELQKAAMAIPAALLVENTESAPMPPTQILPTKTSRRDRVETETESQIRRQIEEQFDISDDVLSSHVKKLRDIRRGNLASPTQVAAAPSSMDVDDQAGSNDDGNIDDAEFMEIDLGVELVCQLDNVFGANAFQRDNLKDIKTTVFMPRALGQQLYAIWMESLYNQIEEQRQKSIKDDEEFAKQLYMKDKHPKIMEKTTPNNLKDIMEMEYAWKAYQSDVDEWKKTTPQDLASKMTRAKLFEIFPNVNRHALVEVLAAHDNKFAKTVEVLKSSLGSDIEHKVEDASKQLLNAVNTEAQTHGTSQRAAAVRAKRALEAKKLDPEQAKREALRDFEDNRNMAMHHSHLKAECYSKANEAFARHDGQVAYYYTNIANLHRDKIDMYNQMAANAIVEVHSYTQQNPDMLDLHYLHTAEAIECLDIFLDKQITQAKCQPRNFKHVFVITGRGLHSAGGFASIKYRVKGRLRERYLTWSEVNPGLLKVRLQGSSPFSQDV